MVLPMVYTCVASWVRVLRGRGGGVGCVRPRRRPRGSGHRGLLSGAAAAQRRSAALRLPDDAFQARRPSRERDARSRTPRRLLCSKPNRGWRRGREAPRSK